MSAGVYIGRAQSPRQVPLALQATPPRPSCPDASLPHGILGQKEGKKKFPAWTLNSLHGSFYRGPVEYTTSATRFVFLARDDAELTDPTQAALPVSPLFPPAQAPVARRACADNDQAPPTRSVGTRQTHSR